MTTRVHRRRITRPREASLRIPVDQQVRRRGEGTLVHMFAAMHGACRVRQLVSFSKFMDLLGRPFPFLFDTYFLYMPTDQIC